MGSSIFVLVIFLVLGFAWFVIYNIIKKKDSDVSSETDEEDMAKEFCPNLLSELMQLRREVKKLKGALDGQGSLSY